MQRYVEVEGMSFWDRLLGRAPPAKDDGEGFSRSSFKSGTAPVFFTEEQGDSATYRRMYEQGGMVGEAIDTYPLFTWTNGYTLEGEDEGPKEAIQEFLDTVEIETLGHKLIVDALVIGKGYAEIVWNRAKNGITGLQYRPAETFTEILDPRGNVVQYQQTVFIDNARKTVDLPPENVLCIDLDMHLIKRAFKDINIDAVIADSTATSIQRHGYPRYHVKLGMPGENVSRDALQRHGKQFEDLKPNMEWTTTQDVVIDNIDKEGIQQALNYTNWSVQRLSAALGVPEELLGLGRGSTEATANVRLEAFRDKIGSIQRRFAQTLNKKVIDILTGDPGGTWLMFNDISPVDEMAKATYVKTLVEASGQIDRWSIITPEWARKYLDIEIDESEFEMYEPEPPAPIPPALAANMIPPKEDVPEVIKE